MKRASGTDHHSPRTGAKSAPTRHLTACCRLSRAVHVKPTGRCYDRRASTATGGPTRGLLCPRSRLPSLILCFTVSPPCSSEHGLPCVPHSSWASALSSWGRWYPQRLVALIWARRELIRRRKERGQRTGKAQAEPGIFQREHGGHSLFCPASARLNARSVSCDREDPGCHGRGPPPWFYKDTGELEIQKKHTGSRRK